MAIPVNDKLVTVEGLKAGLDTKANAADVYEKTETYTKTEVDDAIQQSTALSTLMTATSGAGANDNPATYTPGLYSLAGSSYNSSYWPTSNLYGILIIWDTAYYREALFLGSGNSLYKGHVSKTASPLLFAWRTITTT